ncbi:MAG: hypothetical protein HY550_08115 [Elusimicrobia bacterium]|nr:hypothetical protein [Elusimicrobiota bacterium]
MVKRVPRLRSVLGAFTAALLLAGLCGCAGSRAASKSQSPAKASSAKPAVSAAEQKKAYDRGMKFYTQEQYKEARKAWQEAVRMGPNTPIGKQAQDYLRDVEQTIKTLEGIQGK